LPGQLSQDDCARLFTSHPLIDKGGGGGEGLGGTGQDGMAARVGGLRHRLLVVLRSTGRTAPGWVSWPA
jgi:hypothetical protein